MTEREEISTGEIEYILTVARALVSKPEKWLKGRFKRSSDQSFCIAGAIGAVAKRPEQVEKVVHCLCHVLNLYPSRGELVGWNDKPERIHKDVLAAFDAAILKNRTLGT